MFSAALEEAHHKLKEAGAGDEHGHGEHEHEHGSDLHTYIGVSLVLGFIFMLLVDQIGSGNHAHGGLSGE